jgi:hypothetical protein
VPCPNSPGARPPPTPRCCGQSAGASFPTSQRLRRAAAVARAVDEAACRHGDPRAVAQPGGRSRPAAARGVVPRGEGAAAGDEPQGAAGGSDRAPGHRLHGVRPRVLRREDDRGADDLRAEHPQARGRQDGERSWSSGCSCRRRSAGGAGRWGRRRGRRSGRCSRRRTPPTRSAPQVGRDALPGLADPALHDQERRADRAVDAAGRTGPGDLDEAVPLDGLRGLGDQGALDAAVAHVAGAGVGAAEGGRLVGLRRRLAVAQGGRQVDQDVAGEQRGPGAVDGVAALVVLLLVLLRASRGSPCSRWSGPTRNASSTPFGATASAAATSRRAISTLGSPGVPSSRRSPRRSTVNSGTRSCTVERRARRGRDLAAVHRVGERGGAAASLGGERLVEDRRAVLGAAEERQPEHRLLGDRLPLLDLLAAVAGLGPADVDREVPLSSREAARQAVKAPLASRRRAGPSASAGSTRRSAAAGPRTRRWRRGRRSPVRRSAR